MDLQPVIAEAYALLHSGTDEALPVAQGICLRVLEKDPPNINARIILARIAQQNYQYALAIQYLLEATERNPAPAILRELAQAWIAIGRHDKALELLTGIANSEGADADDARIVSELADRLQATKAVQASRDMEDVAADLATGLVEWTEMLDGLDDVELEIRRVSRLTYHVTAPRSDQAQGLVVLVPGFGEDATADYQRKLRTYIAERYQLAVVSVEHHCVNSRLSTGAAIRVPPRNRARIKALCAAYGIEYLSGNIEKSIADLGAKIPDLAIGGILVPQNGEYQNFGVLQAMDYLTVLGHLFAQEKVSFDRRNIILFGSSHGGYIAHLVAKFAPNSISAVVSNSGYLGLGAGTWRFISGEVDPAQIHFTGNIETIQKVDNLSAALLLNTVTPWSTNAYLNGKALDEGHRDIRSLPKHLEVRRRASLGPIQYRMIHSTQDTTESCNAWRAYALELRNLKNDVELVEVTAQDVDGEFIKTLDHGLGISLRGLFDRFYPGLKPRASNMTDFDFKTKITFDCAPFRKYSIHFHPGRVELSVHP